MWPIEAIKFFNALLRQLYAQAKFQVLQLFKIYFSELTTKQVIALWFGSQLTTRDQMLRKSSLPSFGSPFIANYLIIATFTSFIFLFLLLTLTIL